MSQKPLDATASLPVYNLQTQEDEKNTCLIFDIRNFDEGLDVTPRNNELAEKDLLNMQDLFEKLNFKVVVNAKSPTRRNIGLTITQRYKVDEFQNMSCIAVVVLSKGIKDYFIAQDGMFKMEWIWQPLILNPDLKEKPKLFIFQIEEIELPSNELQTDNPGASKGSDVPPECKERVPQAHMIYIHYRVPEKINDTIPMESRFSKIMFDCFTDEQAKDKHIGEVMAIVNRKLAMSSLPTTTSEQASEAPGEQASEPSTDAVTDDTDKPEENVEENKKVEENKLKPWKHEVPCTVSHLPSLFKLQQNCQ